MFMRWGTWVTVKRQTGGTGRGLEGRIHGNPRGREPRSSGELASARPLPHIRSVMRRATGVIRIAGAGLVGLLGLVGTLAPSVRGAEPKSFDYVVVGAGASGSVVAARLSA